MTLVKTTPTPVRAFAVAKASVSGPTGKSPPTMKKAVDATTSLKKPPAPSSPIKGKPTSAPMKPATKPEPSVVKVEKSPIKMEKPALKLTVTKASIGSTIKSPPAAIKSPVPKSPAKDTKTPPIRNVAKPIITPRTPELKQLDSKKDISTVRSSEKLGSKTIANSVSVSKSPIKLNTLSSPVKSISSPPRSVASPAKSISSPSKSISSPVKSVSASATSIKSISSPTKSVSSPTKLISSAAKSISSPTKSVSSPTKLISSAAKSISSPVKSGSPPATSISSPTRSISSPVKSLSSPSKSISSPIKSILSPIKPKITREVNLSSPGKPKDTKVTLLSPSSSIKKPLNLLKSPIKPPGKVDVAGKLKPVTKSSPTTKVVKNNAVSTKTTVKKQPTVAAIDEVSNISDCSVEKLDLRHSDETLQIGEASSNDTGIITEYTIDNTSNFDVVQAFKVAEQLIKIQSNDRNLETIIESCENTSGINWDDVIVPCDDFVVSNPNDKLEPPSLVQNDLAVSSLNAEESASNCDSCIIEMANSNHTADSQLLLDGKQDDQNDKLVISTNCDENNNVAKLIDIVVPSSTPSRFSEIEIHDEKYFTNELPFKASDNDSIPEHNDETESAELDSDDEENSSNCADDSIEHHCDQNVVLPEWTITIDEFSIDLSGKEIQSLVMAEKENSTVDEIPCSVGLSYADILKKSPNVLANSTNLELPRKEPKLNDDTLIKSHQSPKKGKSSSPKDTPFDDIENNYRNCDDLYDVPEYCDMRKKKHKKIKHLSRRHLRNVNRECEYIESQSDIFVTHVWKDIILK